MKKYVAGFLAGAVFVLSASAFADDIQSLIGKKIQGEAVVELNGQALILQLSLMEKAMRQFV